MSFEYEDFMWKIIHNAMENDTLVDIVRQKNMKDINEKLVNDILNNHFTDKNYMEMLKSVFDSIITYDTQKTRVGKAKVKKIPCPGEWITEIITSICLACKTETAEGVALFANFKSVENMIVIKGVREEKRNIGMLFEYFVGAFGINKIRDLTPNFAYTFSVFRSNPVEVQYKTGKINNEEEFCSTKLKDERIYIIYERIKGKTLHDFIGANRKTISVTTIFSYILQIAFALEIAQREIEFTHYDLHNSNIILRDIPSPIDVHYTIDGKVYTITTDKIPTIIDYGFCHFVYNNVPMGRKDLSDYGIVPLISRRGFDLYKMISYTMYALFTTDVKTFLQCSWIYNYKYFQNDPFGIQEACNSKDMSRIKRAFNIGWKKYYNIELNHPIGEHSPFEFIKWIESSSGIWKHIVRVSDEPITSVDILSSYKSKVDGYKIFNNSPLEDLLNCDLFNTKYNSYIMNSYITGELTKILDTFGNHIKDEKQTRLKIQTIIDQTKENELVYKRNDSLIISKYEEELSALSSRVSLESCNEKIKRIRTMFDVKRIIPEIDIIQKFISTYKNYKMMISYSKVSKVLVANPLGTELSKVSDQSPNEDPVLKNYYFSALEVCRNFCKNKGEFLFESLRGVLGMKNKEGAWVSIVQAIILDLEKTYPELEYVYQELKEYVYNIAIRLSTKNVLSYVCPDSNKQFLILLNYNKEYIYKILEDYVSSNNMEAAKNIVERVDLNDVQIYKELSPFISNEKLTKTIRTQLNELVYTFLKKSDTNKLLDLGSPLVNKNYEKVLRDWGIVPENCSVLDLAKWGFERAIQIKSSRFPFADDSFDLVSSISLINSIDNLEIENILKEVRRVLKPGGMFLLQDYINFGNDNKGVLFDIHRHLFDPLYRDKTSTYIDINLNAKLFSNTLRLTNSFTRGMFVYRVYTK